MSDQNLSLKHVRRNCLRCSGEGMKHVTWCPCDGLHSTRCEFWPFRFGIQPATFRARYGDRLLDPKKMPPADVDLDKLPSALEAAATGEISADGYHQPAVEIVAKPKRTLTPEQKREITERLRRTTVATGAA